MVIRQGDLYWVNLGHPVGSAPGFRRPIVVVQNDAANRSRLRTVIVCSVTSNLRFATAPGNVLVKATDSGLADDSVVNVSQLSSIDKDDLDELIGQLSPRLIQAVVTGIQRMVNPTPSLEFRL
jgi:mRNA interferase MazF